MRGAPRFAAEVERRVWEVFAWVKAGGPPLQPNVEINAALLLDVVSIQREASLRYSQLADTLAGSPAQQRSRKPGA